MWANTWHLSKLTAAIPWNTRCFSEVHGFIFYTLESKTVLCQIQLEQEYAKLLFLLPPILCLLFIRQNSLWIRNGFGKSWCILDAIGSRRDPSRDCTWKPERRETFIALQTLLFAWGLSNCGLWNIWPSRFIDRDILSIKIYLKDVNTSVFSNHNWPLNTG